MFENETPSVVVADAEGLAIALSGASTPEGRPIGGVALAMGLQRDLRAFLAVLPDGSAGLLFIDANRQPRVGLGVGADGTPVIDIRAVVASSPAPTPERTALADGQRGED